METDPATVRILETLDRLKIAGNTLIFFTADNGCSPEANFAELGKKGHDPGYSLRSHKADAWDGGHRVPYVVRWPGVIEPGRVSDGIICHNNLMATCADILGAKLPDDAGVDSFSILPVLRGEETKEPTHPFVIHHSVSGRFAIRKGDWKFIAAMGSGGWSKGGDGKPSQLYNMATDRKESDNLVDGKPEIATPHIDKLAAQGMRLTDGHSSSGVCSPSRYTLLTGRHHWRGRLQRGIVGMWEPPAIPPDRMTIASLAKQNGYRTACIGKWHLGWDWPIPKGKRNMMPGSKQKDVPATEEQKAFWKELFSQPIPGESAARIFGPTRIFDCRGGMASTGSRRSARRAGPGPDPPRPSRTSHVS